MSDFKEEHERKKRGAGKKDYDEKHPLNKDEGRKFEDDMPLEELKIAMKQEKKKHKSQDESESK